MIAELDNTKLREVLYSLFVKQDIPHAFLFTGPKGLGKTSTARIISKLINCEQPVKQNGTIEPCNVCISCVSITKGTHVDVLEIDGASNRGIDEIRDLREKVRFAPSQAKKKVYIIDEVHMLTTEAFNALLKTIEEPPDHVMFLFATTEPQKVPATILSRCFHISLAPATQEELLRAFKRVANGESLSVDEDALIEIAKLAEGGFRDGTKILEEVALLAKEKKISKALIDQVYHVSAMSSSIDELIAAFADRDVKKGLTVIQKVSETGIDLKVFLTQLIQKLHGLLLTSIEGKKTAITTQDIQMILSLLTQAYQEMRFAVLPQLPLEMAVIIWAGGKQTLEVRGQEKKTTIEKLIKEQKNLKVQAILGKEEKKASISESDDKKTQQTELPKNVDELKSLMENIIYRVQSTHPSVAGLLRGCTILSVDDDAIVFQAGFKFHKEKLDDSKNRDILSVLIKEITGKNLKITIVLKS